VYEHLLVTQPESDIRMIALHRPRKFNALTKQTIHELHTAISDFENSEASVMVLTGSGRAFCYGADFAEFENRDQLPQLLQDFQHLILKLYRCPKITVASLNGFATGAGLDLALACDFRIASERAKLGEAYISMGLVSDGGGSFFLTHAVGIARAIEMLLLGEAVTAADAKTLGIVHRVHPAEELEAATLDLAKNLASRPQAALRLLKKLVQENATADLETALKREGEAQLLCFRKQE
jgi:enoyl-CoA hydratase/carnithine racemase